MTKQSRIDVEHLLGEYSKILSLVGVPKQQINVAKGLKYKVHHFVKAFDWLHDFILSFEMSEWERVRNMRPEETWDHYDLMEIEGLQEQILLQEVSTKLLKRWRRKRPRMFGPDREIKDDNVQSDQKDSSELCV